MVGISETIRKTTLLIYFLFIIIIVLNATSAFSSNATLSWNPPTKNTDGTPLTDLAGYIIYYGTSSGPPYPQGINVGNVTTYTVQNLTEGLTYYFAVTAYDTSWHRSDYSNEVHKTIPQQFTLTVTKSGTGSGTVTSTPADINCGSYCLHSYPTGTVVTLSASANASSTFIGWSGGGCSGNGQCVLTINANTTVTASYDKIATSITVTFPVGGENWQAGSTHTIRWTYTGNPGENVKIKLFKGKVLKRVLGTETVGSGGSGFYQWTIPLGQRPGTTYKVQVVSTANNLYKDFSSKFTITPPLRVTNPNGGEIIPSGSNYTIMWDAHPEIASYSYKLQYSLDNGATWKLIENNILGTNYDWRVPSPLDNQKKCRIKVTGYKAGGVKVGVDRSDAPFTIEVVNVTSPNGGETLTSGSTHTITWATNEAKNPVAKVKLFYTMIGGVTRKPIATITGSNPGSFDWTVPTVITEKTQCKVKVVLMDANGKTVGSNASDGYFTIQP